MTIRMKVLPAGAAAVLLMIGASGAAMASGTASASGVAASQTSSAASATGTSSTATVPSPATAAQASKKSSPQPEAAKPPPPPPPFTGVEYAAQAAIGLEDARRIALKAHPGSLTNSELGPGKNGVGLRYDFTIGGSHVYVDAQTGKILGAR